jgi:dienelactone hydrolase
MGVKKKDSSLKHEVEIPVGHKLAINADLCVPENASSLILFAHGSGSSRFSERNRYVAEVLENKGFATLLVDLLTKAEDMTDAYTAQYRFDIPLLTERVVASTEWVQSYRQTKKLEIGYFGASTGAAAALIASTLVHNTIRALVSRGGRVDMADNSLPKVKSAVLLIVGGNDTNVIELNRDAYDKLSCNKRLEIVPHAGHLFQEQGALEKVAHLACNWFVENMSNKI